MTLNLKAGVAHKMVIYVTQINNLHGNVDGGHENKHTIWEYWVLVTVSAAEY